MTVETDYPYIRAWGIAMCWSPGYTNDQVAMARKEKAPENATWRAIDGVWATMDDLGDNERFREKLEELANEFTGDFF